MIRYKPILNEAEDTTSSDKPDKSETTKLAIQDLQQKLKDLQYKIKRENDKEDTDPDTIRSLKDQQRKAQQDIVVKQKELEIAKIQDEQESEKE
jgi:hypothetical protein